MAFNFDSFISGIKQRLELDFKFEDETETYNLNPAIQGGFDMAPSHEKLTIEQQTGVIQPIEPIPLPKFEFSEVSTPTKHEIGFKETLKYLPETVMETVREAPTKIAWATKLAVPGVRDKYIEENPNAVIDFVDDYEKIIAPFIRTSWPTKVLLSTAEKFVGKKLAATYDEMAQKNPVVTTLSGLVGDIYNLVAVSTLTQGIGVGIQLPSWMRVTFPWLSRFVPAAIHGGTTWGLKGIMDETTNQFEKGTFDPAKIATEGGKEFVFGTLLSGAMVVESTIPRILASGGFRASWSALEAYMKDGTIDSNDLLNIGANGILGIIFASINADGTTQRIKQQKFDDYLYRQNLTRMTEMDVPPEEAEPLLDLIQKLGGLQMMPPAIHRQIERNIPESLKNLTNLEQIRIADEIIKTAQPLIDAGGPIWESIVHALQKIGFPKINIPLLGDPIEAEFAALPTPEEPVRKPKPMKLPVKPVEKEVKPVEKVEPKVYENAVKGRIVNPETVKHSLSDISGQTRILGQPNAAKKILEIKMPEVQTLEELDDVLRDKISKVLTPAEYKVAEQQIDTRMNELLTVQKNLDEGLFEGEEISWAVDRLWKEKAIKPSKRKIPAAIRRFLRIPEPKKITKKEDILLKMKLRAEAKGAKTGFKFGRVLTRQEMLQKFRLSKTQIGEARELTMKYIKENLPPQSQAKFIQALSKDLTMKRVSSIFLRVDKLKERLKTKELIGDIRKIQKTKGRLAVDYQKKLDELLEGINLTKPTEKTLKRLRKLSEWLRENGVPLNMPQVYLDRLKRLSRINIKDMSTDEIESLRETVLHLERFGKFKAKLKWKYDEIRRENDLKKLLESTKNIDPQTSGKDTKWDLAKIAAKKIYMDTLHTMRVADMIDDFKNYKGENAKIIKRLWEREKSARLNATEISSNMLDEIEALEIGVLEEQDLARIMINIRIQEGARDQARVLMQHYKFDEVPDITVKEQNLIKIIKRYVNKNKSDIAFTFEEIENKVFPAIENYILPIKYERDVKVPPSETIRQTRYRKTKTFKGFTMPRLPGVAKIPRIDVLAIAEQAISEQQWYIKVQPELEDLKYLVKDEKYLAKGGELAYTFWTDQIDIVARRGWGATAKTNFLLRQARLNINRGVLAYKLSSILMQPFAIFDAMSYSVTRFNPITAFKILGEFLHSWINPKYAKAVIEASDALKIRKGGEIAIEEALEEAEGKGKLKKYQREGFKFLQKADVITAAGVESALIDILEKEGHPNVKQEAEFLMELVSGSSSIVLRPQVLSTGEEARTWFTFQMFFLNRWGLQIHDIIQKGLFKTKEWKKKLGALLALMIFIAGQIAEDNARKSLYEFVTKKKTLKELPLSTQMLLTVPSNIPYFGNVIEGVMMGWGSGQPPLMKIIENIFQGLKQLTGEKTETKIKGGIKTIESAITMLFGLAGTAQIADLIERMVVPPDVKRKSILPELPEMPGLPELPELPKLPTL